MNKSCYYTFTLCRCCKRFRKCLDGKSNSNHSYICIDCASEKDIVGACVSCGREGLAKELKQHGGYCHLCENRNIGECDLCGRELYKSKLEDGICDKCKKGINKPCIKCGDYMDSNKLSSDGLCSKCSIKIHRKLRDSEVNEIVECVECGREVLVNDLNENDGVCIYCYSKELENQVVRLRKRAYR